MKRSVMMSIAAALLVTAGCGGDDDATVDPAGGEPAAESSEPAAESDAPAAESGEPAVEPAEPAPDPATPAAPTGSGTATVSMEGETYRFEQIEPGPDDDYYVFCTVVAGSLQAVLRQVDDTGNTVEGELSVVLLEPGGAYEQTGDPAEVQLDIDGRSLRYVDGDPMAATSSGAAGGGTVTLQETLGFSGETGEIETQPVDVSLDVSC